MSVKDKGIELRRPNFMAADTVYHFVVADETDVRRLALPCLALPLARCLWDLPCAHARPSAQYCCGASG